MVCTGGFESMYIDLKVIQDLLKEYKSNIYLHDFSLCLDYPERLAGAMQPYFQHTLYLTDDPEELNEVEPIEYLNLLVLNPKKKDLSSYYQWKGMPINILDLHAPAEDFKDIYVKVRHFFDQEIAKGLAGEFILDTLYSERGIQTMVEELAPAFNNPVYFFDSGFNLVACNYENAEKTERGKRLIENGGFIDEDYKIINAYGHFHEKLKKTEKPIRVFRKEVGHELLLCSIDTRKDMGHLVIDAVNTPLKEADYNLLYMLKTGIYQQMQKDEFIRNNTGYPYEYFLRDLLNEKLAAPIHQSEHFSYLNSEFDYNKYCMVIEASRGNDTLNLFSLKSKVELLFPGTKTIVYNGQVVAVFSFPKNRFPGKKETDKIQALCEREQVFAGLSNVFTDITDFRNYYMQALRAIEIGASLKNVACLYIYKDYYMQHIANIFTNKESYITYCDPRLKILLEYDLEHDSELAFTLYTYLIKERRSQDAADTLGIHRNTLSKRFKTIDSLVQIDYENYQERHYLILSYELYQLNYQPEVYKKHL